MSGEVVPLSAPEALTERHVVDRFESSEPSLDAWLSRRAMANQVTGASRTFVLCRADRVVAYYALAAGGIASNEAPGRLRNISDPASVFAEGDVADMVDAVLDVPVPADRHGGARDRQDVVAELCSSKSSLTSIYPATNSRRLSKKSPRQTPLIDLWV